VPNTISVAIELEGKDAIKTLAALNKGVNKLGETGTKSFKSMDIALGSFVGNLGAQAALNAISALGGALKDTAKDALDFGKAIAEINSIAPRTAAETLALKQQLIGLSNEFGGNAQKQAKAFYNIVSAGVKGTANQLQVLEVANKAAVAGLVDIDTAARVLVSSVNSYSDSGLTAQEASDILFSTVKEGITTFEEISASFTAVTGLAATAGVKFSELGGFLGFLTQRGVPTAQAVTQIQSVISALVKITPEATKAAEELGIKGFNAATLKAEGLVPVLRRVNEATGGNVQQIGRLFPNIQALSGVLATSGQSFSQFIDSLEAVQNSAGATDAALVKIQESAAFQFEKLQNQLKNLPLAFLTNFEEPIADALKAINTFVSEQGIPLIINAVDGVIDVYKSFITISSVFDQAINASVDAVLATIETYQEAALAVNQYRQSWNQLTGDLEEVEALKKQEEQLKRNIEVTKAARTANDEAAAAEQENLNKRLASAEEFQAKLEEGRQKEAALKEQRAAEEKAQDDEKAKQQLEDAIGKETEKFNAIEELKAAQEEEKAEKEEEAKLAKELEDEEEFQKLEEALGRETAARELNRIKNIEDEKKRKAELRKLNQKAEKENKASLVRLFDAENATNSQKVAAQRETLQTLANINAGGNGALFAVSKAASLSLAGINIAEGVTKAFALGPILGPVAAGAIAAAGAIQIAKIASSKPPPKSAGSFQGGGIIPGDSPVGDRLTANVNSGEVIFNRRQQQNLFNAVNEGNLGGGGGSVTINVESATGDIPDENIDRIIDSINNRTEFGNKELRGVG